jgi:hypothetical protein
MASSKLTWWRKGGRFLTGLVVLCFFLPFFGVSCRGFDVVTISGMDMVGGCKLDARGASADELPKAEVEPLAIIAVACAVVGFGLAWVKTRGALIGALVVSIAGLGALGGLYFKVKSNLDDAVEKELDKKGEKGGDTSRTEAKIMEEMDLDVGARMGLWLTALGMVSVAGLAGMALKDTSGGPAAAVPIGGPPQGYPPQGGGYPPQGGG